MYKDKEKQKEANRKSAKRYRKGMTQPGGIEIDEGDTAKPEGMTQGMTVKGMTQYPDIIDKLTDPFWRGRLEKICHAFKASNNPSYSKDVWLGDTNLSVACDWLECTR